MKTCNKCNIEKDYLEFNKRNSTKDGYYSSCKECRYGYKPHNKITEGLKICTKCNEAKDIEQYSFIKRKGKLYRQASCKTCRNKASDLKRKNTIKYKERMYKRSDKAALKRKYGMSTNDYDKLLIKQNNLCAICNKPEIHFNSKGRIQRLSVDHCHSTGIIRGLLCKNCNSGLGQFRDSSEIMLKAIQYLKETNTDKS